MSNSVMTALAGPWQLVHGEQAHPTDPNTMLAVHRIIDDDSVVVATTSPGTINAQAAVMAAAPVMFAALVKLRDKSRGFQGWHASYNDVINDINEALAQAIKIEG